MSTMTVAGTITNSGGAIANFTGTINIVDPPVIDSVSVSPDPAAPGTLRTITVVAHDPQDQQLTYSCQVNGVDATPTETPHVFTFQA
jgi:hypothetical protein